MAIDKRIRRFQTTHEATFGTHFLVDYRFRAAVGSDLETAAYNILSLSSVGSLSVLPYQPGFSRGLLDTTVSEFGGYIPNQHDGGTVTIAYPLAHCTTDESLPGLLQLISAGAEYSYTEEYWIERLTLPRDFIARYPGPRFGTEKWRDRLEVRHRAVLGLTLGPRFGVKLDEIAKHASEALAGGCDFICDDVLLNAPAGEMSFFERVPKLVDVANKASQSTGTKKSYFAFVLGTPKTTLERSIWAVEQGVDAIITNAAALGLGGLEDLVNALDELGKSVPIITTNMGVALTSRAPADGGERLSKTGMSEAVFAKLCRLVGADGVHTGTVGAECYGEMEWNRISRDVTEVLGETKPCYSVAAGNLGLAQVWENISQLGPDVMLEVSSGILNYPGGTRAGAAAFRKLADALDPDQMTNDDAEAAINEIAKNDTMLLQVLNSEWKA